MDYLIKHRHTHTYESFEVNCWKKPFFLSHSLTTQETITNKSLICYCIQIEFTSLVRIRNSVCTCLDWFKAGSKLVLFSRVSSVLCFGCHVFSSGSFGCSRVETWDGCVTSPGKLSSAIVEFVAPLRLWHSLRPPPMVGSEVSVQRTGAHWRA